MRCICVFDYDDTLMKTRECKTAALKALASRYYGVELSSERIEQHWGISHQRLLQILLNIDSDQLPLAMQRYAALDDEFPLIAHVDSSVALSELHAHYRLVIVSSCRRGLIEQQLKKSCLDHIEFDAIFGDEDTSYHKPSGRVFNGMRALYPSYGLDDFIYIGDGWKDCEAAGNAGIRFMGVDRSAKETAEMQRRGAQVFSNLIDIAAVLINTTD